VFAFLFVTFLFMEIINTAHSTGGSNKHPYHFLCPYKVEIKDLDGNEISPFPGLQGRLMVEEKKVSRNPISNSLLLENSPLNVDDLRWIPQYELDDIIQHDSHYLILTYCYLQFFWSGHPLTNPSRSWSFNDDGFPMRVTKDGSSIIRQLTCLLEDICLIIANYVPETFDLDRKTILWAERHSLSRNALKQRASMINRGNSSPDPFPVAGLPETKARFFNPDAEINGILFRQLVYNLFLEEWHRHFHIKCLDPQTGVLEIVEPTSITVTSDGTRCKEHQRRFAVCAVESVKALGVTLKLADCVTHPSRYRLAPLVVLQRVSQLSDPFRSFVCLGAGNPHMVEKDRTIL